MIRRIWHGWTSLQNASAYERLLWMQVFPGIEAKRIQGYRRIELLRRDHSSEVEFITIMSFETLNDVRAFAGADYEKAYVPPEARDLLQRYDARSQHYHVVEPPTEEQLGSR